MFHSNDWFSWYYDNEIIPGVKPSVDAIWKFKINKTITRPIKSYKEELLLNAQRVRDEVSGPLDLMLSGGIDSEIILRSYLESKIPINVFVFKYENNINIRDIDQCIEICKSLNVIPTIIDFNLQKFFENDAYDIWQKGYFHNAGRLPHMKMLDYLDNTPIMGDGYPAANEAIIKIDGDWMCATEEVRYNQTMYCKSVGRHMIHTWHEYSPELVVSFLNNKVVRKFVEKKILFDNFIDLKYFNHKLNWPIKIREKLVGFEGDLPANQIKPEFMNEFNRCYVDNIVKSTRYIYSIDELVAMII